MTSVRPPVRVALVEDEPLFRDLLRNALDHEEGLEVVGAFGDADTAAASIPGLLPDVLVLDINLGGTTNGVQLGVRLRRTIGQVGIVLLSSLRDPSVLSSLPADVASGWSYLLKSSVGDIETLRRAIFGAAAGMVVLDRDLVSQAGRRSSAKLDRLTGRQRELLELMAAGYTNQAIAHELFLAEKSVENHLSRLYQALEIDTHDPAVHPRVQAVLTFLQSR